MDRTDENSFQEENSKKQTKIDFALLKSCSIGFGRLVFGHGLECGGKESGNCIRPDYFCAGNWKKRECPVLGKNITTNHPTAKSTNSGKTNLVEMSMLSDARLATVGSV